MEKGIKAYPMIPTFQTWTYAKDSSHLEGKKNEVRRNRG